MNNNMLDLKKKKLYIFILLFTLIFIVMDYRSPVVSKNPNSITYYDCINKELKISDEELQLLKENKLIISSKREYNSPGDVYNYLKNKNLPVFITTDSILYAYHMSYTKILPTIENKYIAERIYNVLVGLKNSLNENKKNIPPIVYQDLVKFSTLFMCIYTGEDANKYSKNKKTILFVKNILRYIKSGKRIRTNIFGIQRYIDFNLFRPRGHYQESDFLERYYKTIIGFAIFTFHLQTSRGKINFRNCNNAFWLTKLMVKSSAWKDYVEMRQLLDSIVGSPDAITPIEARNILSHYDNLNVKNYYSIIKTFKRNFPKKCLINNEINYAGDRSYWFSLMDRVVPLDSESLKNLIYSRLKYKKKVVRRFHPQGLDCMYILGNDNAKLYLKKELQKYPYAHALQKERDKMDAINEDQWNKSLYNKWLKIIKEVHQPELKSNKKIPSLFRNSSWDKKILNTQLTSWAHLRHDFLAYIHEPGPDALCASIDAYLEPNPDVYRNLQKIGEITVSILKKVKPKYKKHLALCKKRYDKLHGNDELIYSFNGPAIFISGSMSSASIEEYYENFIIVMKKLTQIAEKELKGIDLSKKEINFLRGTMQIIPRKNLYSPLKWDGWYVKLFYDPFDFGDGMNPFMDFFPTIASLSAEYAPKQQIKYIAAGKINLAFFLLDFENGKNPELFCGPIGSYYEFIVPGLTRFDDYQLSKAMGQPINRSEYFDKNKLSSEVKLLKSVLDRYVFPEYISSIRTE